MAGVTKFKWPRESKTALHADPKADLRGVHWQLGYRDFDPARTEAKLRYLPTHGAQPTVLDPEQAKELRRSHVDLAVAEEKTGRAWKAVMTDEMSRNAGDKFGCRKPQGFEALSVELRKSSVSLSDLSIAPGKSEQKLRYAMPPPFNQAKSYADTLGKDLRASHYDMSNGREKIARDWMSAQQAEMSRHVREKFDCEKPSGMDALSKELRKSSIPLGSAFDIRTRAR
mmetsp:Transcript_33110/g.83771  ORF Transcript_33110/g.83771 Transcript_33110/m.83771 type:complete len:227 (+) Transcript_33110:113-793(+)